MEDKHEIFFNFNRVKSAEFFAKSINLANKYIAFQMLEGSWGRHYNYNSSGSSKLVLLSNGSFSVEK